ncbi:ArnT family glycosyltransferase [Corynebacterium antarcticum]|uniref:ArnT family glycosyltransferase n=1 Tax=Corynebacterium antarcticum TaxID=2800405 RepID=UPI003D00697D
MPCDPPGTSPLLSSRVVPPRAPAESSTCPKCSNAPPSDEKKTMTAPHVSFRHPRLTGLITAGIAVVAAVAAQVASHRPVFHHSLLLNVTEGEPLAQLIRAEDPAFRFTTGADHYDGVYLWAMARDPFASGQAHELIDLAAYRYGHPFYSWMASLLAFGQPRLLSTAFWILGLASIGTAAYLVSRLAASHGCSPWWGLLVAASPGLLFSSTTDLTEPFQLALVTGLLLAWRARVHPTWIAVLCMVICLSKEQLVLVPAALGIHLLSLMVRDRRLYWRRALALATGPIALAAWLPFIRSHFSADQLTYDDGNIGMPVIGWLRIFDLAGSMRVSGDMNSSQIGSTAVPALIALAVLMLAAAVIGLIRRDELGLIVATQAVLVSCLDWRTLFFPHEMYRIPAVPALLAALLVIIHLTTGCRATSTGADDRRPAGADAGGLRDGDAANVGVSTRTEDHRQQPARAVTEESSAPAP